MYEDNLIAELPSCLKKTFETALMRFNEMHLVEIKNYTASDGSLISFISCPFDQLEKLEEMKIMINKLQQFGEHQLKVIDDKTTEAIQNALV